MPIRMERLHRNCNFAVNDDEDKLATVINNNEIQISNNDVNIFSNTTTTPSYRLSSTLLSSSICMSACIM